MHVVPNSCKCKKVVLFASKFESFGGKSHYGACIVDENRDLGLEILLGKQNHSRQALVFQYLVLYQVKKC